MTNKRSTGTRYEEIAANELRRLGYRILERNFYSRAGEIDIVAREDRYLVFVEVKFRTRVGAGAPEEAVDIRKQRKICRAALYYMTRHGISDQTPVRFDVVAVEPSDIRIIRNAFEFID